MAAVAAHEAVMAAPLLPARLIRFFAKYPPQRYSALATGQVIPTMKPRKGSSSAVSQSLEATIPTFQELDSADRSQIPAATIEPPSMRLNSHDDDQTVHNPFLPWRNHTTGRWRGAAIGLRQQADLCKLARQHGVEELLPPSIKSSEYRQRRALERGLQVKGTGEGQTVKGHKWERNMQATMEKRRTAMEEMPEMIRLWKQKGHGRGWKKYAK